MEEGLEVPDTLWYSHLMVVLWDRSLFNPVEMEYRGITSFDVVVTGWMRDEIGSKGRATCEKDGGLVTLLLRLYPGGSESPNGICGVEEVMLMCCGRGVSGGQGSRVRGRLALLEGTFINGSHILKSKFILMEIYYQCLQIGTN